MSLVLNRKSSFLDLRDRLHCVKVSLELNPLLSWLETAAVSPCQDVRSPHCHSTLADVVASRGAEDAGHTLASVKPLCCLSIRTTSSPSWLIFDGAWRGITISSMRDQSIVGAVAGYRLFWEDRIKASPMGHFKDAGGIVDVHAAGNTATTRHSSLTPMKGSLALYAQHLSPLTLDFGYPVSRNRTVSDHGVWLSLIQRMSVAS